MRRFSPRLRENWAVMRMLTPPQRPKWSLHCMAVRLRIHIPTRQAMECRERVHAQYKSDNPRCYIHVKER